MDSNNGALFAMVAVNLMITIFKSNEKDVAALNQEKNKKDLLINQKLDRIEKLLKQKGS